MTRFTILLGVIYLALVYCIKNPESNSDSEIITGISSSKGSEMVSIKLDSGEIYSVPVSCYNLGSTVFDSKSHTYSYCNCDKVFVLTDPVKGETLKQFQLSGDLSQAVIDTSSNTLAGRLGVFSTSYVIRMNLVTGILLSAKPINIGEGILASSYYYNNNDKEYVLLRSDSTLISIDPATGTINKSLPIGHYIHNIIYIPDNNTLICRSYSSETNKSYVEVIDAETGTQLSKKAFNSDSEYFYACVAGYDPETNCYLQVTDKDEVLFIEVATGEVKKLYKLKDPLNDIKFWRR